MSQVWTNWPMRFRIAEMAAYWSGGNFLPRLDGKNGPKWEAIEGRLMSAASSAGEFLSFVVFTDPRRLMQPGYLLKNKELWSAFEEHLKSDTTKASSEAALEVYEQKKKAGVQTDLELLSELPYPILLEKVLSPSAPDAHKALLGEHRDFLFDRAEMDCIARPAYIEICPLLKEAAHA